MPVSNPNQRAGVSLGVQEPYPPATPVQHGETSQTSRAMALGSYFLSGVMAVNASQFLAAPLRLINEEWYNSWIAYTKQSFGLLTMTMTQWWAPTVVRVSGDASVRSQLMKTADGNLLCAFPQRMVLIANHQIYTDWLYLWWIAYTAGMHGRIYIVLKESLRKIPVIGWGIQLSQFILLKRNWEQDKPQLATHLSKLNNILDPMWLLLFPEGTNLAPSTREKSRKWAKENGLQDMEHQLLPRSTGLQFCLQELRETVGYVYDCTIAYEGVPRGEYAQDIFTVRASYLQGRPPKSVNLYWRRFELSSIPLDNAKAFDIWLRARWYEKDRLIEQYLRTGSFPADEGVETSPSGKTLRGAGHIDTEIKANYWYEFMQVFAPIGVFAMILYSFYGALPGAFVNSIDKDGLLDKFTNMPKIKVNEDEKRVLKESIDKAQQVTNNQVNGSGKRLQLPPMQRFSSNSSSGLKAAAAPVRRASTMSTTGFKSVTSPPKPALKKTLLPTVLPIQNTVVKKAVPIRISNSKPPSKVSITQKPPTTTEVTGSPQTSGKKVQKPLAKTVLPKTVLPTPNQVNGIKKPQQLNGVPKKPTPIKATTVSPPKPVQAKSASVPKKAELPKTTAKAQPNSAPKKPAVTKSITKPTLPSTPAKKAGAPSTTKSVGSTAPSLSDMTEIGRATKRAQAVKEKRVEHRKPQA